MIQYNTEITLKSLDFIDDADLQIVISQRLEELERVFLVNANLSTIILSISSIEGIFKHLATIFKAEISISPKYPIDAKGRKKQFDKLTIEEIYGLLLERKILQEIENFDKIYKIFRDYRNFIHPHAQKSKLWPIGLGQAQMALGLFNATIEQISKYIFIGTEIFERVSGRPRLDLSRVLHLDVSNTRTHSFMVTKRKIKGRFKVKFDLDLGQNGIFNFVFNFIDEGNFKMLRLDNRNLPKTPNALLYCKQKYYWEIEAEAIQKQPPGGTFKVEILVDENEKKFALKVNGEEYSFECDGKKRDLFPEFKPGKMGWFNEVGPVKLFNLEMN